MTVSEILKSGGGRLALGVAMFSALTVVPAHSANDLGRAPEGQKPTVVLVHGAFADGSSWNGVVQRLQRDGYQVIAPPNTLRGIPQDSTYLNSLLKTIKGSIVLVGHSYGGGVISQAAAGLDNVKALVYVNAIMPACTITHRCMPPGAVTSNAPQQVR
ncbi:alpha/beta fold hydrolase [Streptomyces sp. NPDC002346]